MRKRLLHAGAIWLFGISSFLLTVALNTSFAQPQTVNDVTKQYLPSSPQAASLGKYGDVPVNYHTGGATVTIPLYEVKIGSLSLPLSLTYQTSGIRVTDVASRAGLGWTLQGEGVITRTVRGLPDEESLGYAYTDGILPYTAVTNYLTNLQYQTAEYVAMGQQDSEPDMYYYNFAGRAGKFYVSSNNRIIKVPYNNMVITGGWTITADDGTKYFFAATEGTSSDNGSSIISYTSSWYLTRILTTKNEEILFTYESTPTAIEHGFVLSETDYYSYNGGSKSPVRTLTKQVIGGKRLKTIETRVEKIDFLYDHSENGGNGRLDLKGDYRLAKIRVTSKLTNEAFKEFTLVHAYSSTGACAIPNFPNFPYQSYDSYRLKLLSVIEHPYDANPNDGIIPGPIKKHSFEYDATQLPARCSFDQDHWGYYNAAGNSTLKPYVSAMPASYTYGNRSVNPATLGAESLKKVIYPTGGYTLFEFEPHAVAGQNYGGQRLKAVRDYTDATTLATHKAFTYESALILNPISQTNYYYSMTEVEYPGGCGGTGSQYDFIVRSSGNNVALGMSQGSHIGYGRVTVTSVGVSNGKTVYEYSTPSDLDAGAYFPFPPTTSREHRRGLLLKESQYNSANALIHEKINTYAFVAIDSIGAYKVGFSHDSKCHDWNTTRVDVLAFGVYRMVSEWVKLTSTEEKIYPGPVSSKSDLFYDNQQHLQVTRKEKTRSDGNKEIEFRIYPHDYSSSSTGFVQLLRNNNVSSALIEQVTAVADANGANVQIVGGNVNRYSSTVPGQLSQVDVLQVADPIPLASFRFSSRSMGVLPNQGTATTFTPDAAYFGNVFFDAYDTYGNVTQFHTHHGINVSLKWGYSSSRPIVLVKNAASNQFFYEGFEDTGTTDANAFGGKKIRSGSYTASFVRPAGTTYTLSYWRRDNGNWTLVKTPLTLDNPVINPGVPFDDVFIYPAVSDFRILNFDPTTLQPLNETNSTHTISYYSYDALQRLETIKDYSRDIINSFLYQYKITN